MLGPKFYPRVSGVRICFQYIEEHFYTLLYRQTTHTHTHTRTHTAPHPLHTHTHTHRGEDTFHYKVPVPRDFLTHFFFLYQTISDGTLIFAGQNVSPFVPNSWGNSLFVDARNSLVKGTLQRDF